MSRKYAFIVSFTLLISFIFPTPVHAVSNEKIIQTLQSAFRNFDGVVLCVEADQASSCVKINRDDFENNLSDGGKLPNDSISLIASSEPARTYLSSSRGGGGPMLKFQYLSGGGTRCTYNSIVSGDEEGSNLVLSGDKNCEDVQNAIISTTFNVEVEGKSITKTINAVYLPKLCLTNNCNNTWNDAVSAYSILGLENTGQADPGGIPITLGLTEGLTNLYKWALSLVGITALGFLMFAGVKYAASAGNPSRISDAKDRITRAIVGLALLLVAPLLLTLISPNFTRINDIILESNPSPGAPGVVALSGGGNGAPSLELPPNFDPDADVVDGYSLLPQSDDGSYIGGGLDSSCGLLETIQVVYTVAQRWKDSPQNPDKKSLVVRDLNGGPINSGVCHSTHEHGDSVDISVSNLRVSERIALAKLFIDTGVVTGMVHDIDAVREEVNPYFTETQPNLTAWKMQFRGGVGTGEFMRSIGGHESHFHVKIGDGDGATGTGIMPGPCNTSCSINTGCNCGRLRSTDSCPASSCSS